MNPRLDTVSRCPLPATWTAAILAVCCTTVPAADYYISSQADFDAHRQAVLAPGDNVYFERGKVFNGMYSPTAVGTNNQVIRIGTFGSGPKPIIQNHGVLHDHPTRSGETISAGVFLYNAEYVEVDGLEITNNNGGDQDESLFGIYVLGEDTGKYHNHIHIKNNYVHHVNGAVAGKRRGGIHVHGYSPQSSNTATYNDLRIENNVVDHIGGVGIGTDIDDLVDAHDFNGRRRTNAITNLYVARNWIGNTGRNSVIARDSDYAVYEYNTSANSSLYSTGHSFFNFRTLGMTWQYNEAYGNVGEQPEHDRGGFDADYNSKDTLIQYNYSHDNDWFVGIMKKPNTNVTIRYNLSVNDKGAYHYGFDNDTDVLNVDAYNNTHYFGSGIEPELIPLGRTPRETTFNNNIFYAEDQGTAGSGADQGTNVVFDTNAYHNVTPPNSETNPLTLDPVFLSPGATPRDVDMEFGRDALNGYRLVSGSPYHDSGLPIADPGDLDFWGEALSTATVGASQYNANTQISPGARLFPEVDFPVANAAEVIAADPGQTSLFGDDSSGTMSQTFQVDSSFNLKTIFLGYEYDSAADPSNELVNIEIFKVADVAAEEIIQGSSLLTITGLAMPNLGSSDEVAIVLDTALSLPATTGTEGYALRISNGRNPGFEWRRTGSSSGSPYDFGQAYENGEEKQSGGRDFVMALSASPPLASMGDFNSDGVVDAADYAVWRDTLNATGSGLSADANFDGVVNMSDYDIWAQHYGMQFLSAATSQFSQVPSPASSVLLTIASLFATLRGCGR